MIRKIIIKDAQSLLKYFNLLCQIDPERVERPQDVSKITLEQEETWIQNRINAENNREMIVRCIEEDGVIVGVGEIERHKRWIERHVAEIRFGLIPSSFSQGYKLVQELESQAIDYGLEVLTYFHLETQITGLSIMREMGYREIGKIPKYYKRNGKYVPRVYFEKDLTNA